VYCGARKHFSKLGRVVVRFNKETGQFDCPCVTGSKSCVHLKLAKLHLSVNIPTVLTKSDMNDTSDIENEDTNMELPLREETSIETNAILLQYINYLKAEKSIPEDVLDEIDTSSTGINILPTHISPKEIKCPLCENHPELDAPQLVTNAACIYDIDLVQRGKNEVDFPFKVLQ